MKKIFLSVLLVLLGAFNLNATITATIGNIQAESNSTVVVPITLSGVNGASAFWGFELKVNYNPSLFGPTKTIQNKTTLISAGGWIISENYDANTVMAGYENGSSFVNISLADNTLLYEIQMTYTGTTPAALTWDTANSFFINVEGATLDVTWVNGGITPPTPALVPPVLVAPADLALNLPVATQLSWNAAAGAEGYQVQVSTTNTFSTTVVDVPVTGLTHNLTNLNNATTYFWRVKSTTAAGSSDWSAVRSFTTVAATPATVTLLTPANAATEIAVAPIFTWNTAANAGSYRLQVSTTDAFTTFIYNDVLTATSKSITGLFNATTYYWRVQGINGEVLGNWSDVRSFTTEASTVPVPSMQAANLVFTNTTSTGTTLRWTRGNGENVLVVRYPGNVVNGTPVKGIPYEVGATIGAGTVVYKGNAKRCTVNGLTAGTAYTFKVYEFLNEGPGYNTDNGTLNPRSKTTTYSLSAPTNLAIADFGSDWAEATWDYTGTADFFDVQIATDANFANLVSDYIGADFGDEFASFEGLEGNQQYFVRVRASIDNLFSDWSNTADFTTFFTEPTVAPTALVMNNRTPNTFNVAWTAGNGTKTIVFASEAAITAVPADEDTYAANSDYSAAATFAGAKVVYNGEGTEFELSGLNPETQYFLAAFTYNGTEGAENYFDTPATANGTTFATEPTNPENLVFSNRTQNSIDLDWTGNATKYLVLVNTANTNFPEDPMDGTTYTVGAAFGTNVTVAAIVTDEELAHTSLVANKTHYYKVYAFNGSNGNENYNSEPASGNAKTLAIAPTAGPATLTISDITVNSMKATWSAVTGVTKYLVLRSTTDNFTAPVNGTTYILNDMLGDATIIATGTEILKANTDLAPGTHYYFRAYAVNGFNTAEVYSTEFASADAWTYASVPEAPANFTAENRTRSSMDVAWDNEANSLVLMNTTGEFDFTPVAGVTYEEGTNDIIYVGEGNVLELDELDENTTYFFKIYAIAGEGVSSNYSEALLADATTKSTAVRMELVAPEDVESGATFAVTAELYNTEDELVNPAEGTVVTLSKIAGAGTLYGNLTATVAANGTATFNGLSYFGTSAFTLRVSTVVNNVTLSADKAIVIAPAAPTQQDRAILFSGVTATGMTVKWTKGNGTHRILTMNAPADFAPVNGTVYTEGNNDVVYVGTGNRKVLTGLTQGTNYTFRVFNYNNPTSPKYCTATGIFNPRSRTTLTKGEVAPKDELTEADINTNTFFVGTINPNPVVNTINFKMTKHEEMNMSIAVFDAAGREVATLVNNQLQAIGTHDYSFNLDNSLSSGTYLLVVTAGDQTAVQSFSVVK